MRDMFRSRGGNTPAKSILSLYRVRTCYKWLVRSTKYEYTMALYIIPRLLRDAEVVLYKL